MITDLDRFIMKSEVFLMIFILEDDDNIRKLVCYALNKEGYDVEGFEKPSLFWKRLDEKVPQLILLDIMMPEEDGLSVLKKLQNNKMYDNIPVIMITAKNSEFDKAMGLDLGADDYIAKPFGMVEFISRVRAVLRRYEKTRNKNNIYQNGNLFVDFEKYIIKVSDEPIELSYKEYKLLSVLLEANGKVVSREELLQKVWGEYYGESRTLDVHIRKLRVKLGSAGNCIKTVKNIGYRFSGDSNE